MSNDIVHLTGVIKTHPVLERITGPDGAQMPRLVNTLVGPDNQRHTIVFAGDHAHTARQALTAKARIQLSGQLIGTRRVQVDHFTIEPVTADHPIEPTNSHHSTHQHQESTDRTPAPLGPPQAPSQPQPPDTEPRPAPGTRPDPPKHHLHRRRPDPSGSLTL